MTKITYTACQGLGRTRLLATTRVEKHVCIKGAV